MLKPVASVVALGLLCAPALADSKTYQLGFTLGAGKDARHYAMRLVSDACGDVEAKAPDEHDQIKVCARGAGGDVRLEIDWETRKADREVRNHSTVIAKSGQTFDLDAGAAKLVVAIQ